MGCGDAISLYTVMHSQRNCLIVNQKINICNFINLTIKCTQGIQHSIPALDDSPQNVPSYLSQYVTWMMAPTMFHLIYHQMCIPS